MLHRITRTPLLIKLIALDGLVNAFAFVVMLWAPPATAERVMLVSMFGVLVLNAALVAWALAPLQVLEDTARRVSGGELTARATMPWAADLHLVRIGNTVNELLDRLATERGRVRLLAGLVVAATDAERSRVARELHDGTAQSLSALDMLLVSALEEPSDLTERLEVMRTIVASALTEVRGLAQGMHPRVLDDLGLVPALHQLARQTRIGRSMEVEVHTDLRVQPPAAVSAVLFRVAQEALHNAVKHSEARRVDIHLVADAHAAEVRVRDDGVGFRREEQASGSSGMGLFVMEERMSLAEGWFELSTSPGRGTEVVGRIPLGAPA